KILDIDKLQVVFNGDWFEKMSVLEMLKLTTHATVSQMLARADFKKRLSQNQDISLLEFMYPILQGYDSVKLEADVELGGTDQIFNLLVGRDIQKDFGLPEQVVITTPLLEGIDGVQKMSKSYANFVGIAEAPQEMFGKLMSISDDLMWKYYELLTDEDLGAARKLHPKEAKLKLAENIIGQYHSQEKALAARQEFQRVFSQKEIPQDIPAYKLPHQKANIVDILIAAGVVSSKNEARRLIAQGAVSLNGQCIGKEDVVVDKEGVIKAGKRRFLKLIK
ncbi:tyrosine--tRNA ligase, partial [bacterium]